MMIFLVISFKTFIFGRQREITLLVHELTNNHDKKADVALTDIHKLIK